MSRIALDSSLAFVLWGWKRGERKKEDIFKERGGAESSFLNIAKKSRKEGRHLAQRKALKSFYAPIYLFFYKRVPKGSPLSNRFFFSLSLSLSLNQVFLKREHTRPIQWTAYSKQINSQ